MAKKNTKQTTPKVAKVAAKLLRDPKTPKKVKTVAGAALVQTKPSTKKKS